ncbi:chitinase N-terminal domain-containing protein [Singulisphaera rosea]
MSGRAGAAITNVAGICRSLSEPEVVVEATWVEYSPRRNGADGDARWLMVFRLTKPGEYQLTVTGFDKEGTQSSDNVQITTSDQDGSPLGSSSISWPSNGENISAEADDFCPYGELDDYPLGSVTLTGSHTVALLSSYGDYVTLNFWTAQFDTVPPGSYTLTVKDSNNNGDYKHITA